MNELGAQFFQKSALNIEHLLLGQRPSRGLIGFRSFLYLNIR